VDFPGWVRGERRTAGWAQNGSLRRLMGQPTSTEVLLVTLQKRPPEGAVGRCPAARYRALIPGEGGESRAEARPTLVRNECAPCDGCKADGHPLQIPVQISINLLTDLT